MSYTISNQISAASFSAHVLAFFRCSTIVLFHCFLITILLLLLLYNHLQWQWKVVNLNELLSRTQQSSRNIMMKAVFCINSYSRRKRGQVCACWFFCHVWVPAMVKHTNYNTYFFPFGTLLKAPVMLLLHFLTPMPTNHHPLVEPLSNDPAM